MKTKIPIVSFLLFFTLSCSNHLFSQPGALDLSFNPEVSGLGPKYALAIQTDGKLLTNELLSAVFPGYSRVIRLHTDGSLDTTFNLNNKADQIIHTILLQPNGGVVVGGDFGSYDSVPAGRIARLLSNGTRDTTFHTGTGFNGSVRHLALQPDGKIVVGGVFTEYNGWLCNRLARLHTNGDLDTSFNTIPGANGTIETLQIQPDGKIVIGGDFTVYDNGLHLRIARVTANGTRDLAFADTSGMSAVVFALDIQPDGKIIAGGNFSWFNFASQNKLIRLNGDGNGDSSFPVNQGAQGGPINAVKVLSNGQILVGGGFNLFRNNPTNRLMRVNHDCTVDTSFNIGTGPNEFIDCLLEQADGKIIIGGGFNTYNGFSRSGLARLYNCLTPQPDSIFGNSYSLCNGTPQTYYVSPVAGATKYEWTLPSGWVGTSDSTSITAISNGTGGTITVKAFTDSCGWSYLTVRNIATIQPDAVPLCLVTVDSQSTHNIVIWEKPQTALIDSFYIYREITSNIYTKIASVAYQALSEYHDTTANPNATSYRYKLSVIDTCGAESNLSAYHNTIHLQNLGNGNFQWTFYQIAGTPNPVLSFNVYRDAFGNGNFFPIGNVPGTNATFTDVTANSFPNALYVVDADWGINCDPSRAVNTTRSNIKHKGIIDIKPGDTTGVSVENILNEQITVYPNPVKDYFTVIMPDNIEPGEVSCLNIFGQTVQVNMVRTTGNRLLINVANLAPGVYLLNIKTTKGILRPTIIKE